MKWQLWSLSLKMYAGIKFIGYSQRPRIANVSNVSEVPHLILIWQSKNGCTNLVNTKLWNLLEKFEDAQGVVRSYKLKDRRKRTNKTINGMQNTTQTKQHELHTKKATYIFKERVQPYLLCQIKIKWGTSETLLILPNFWLWEYLMNFIPETCCAH
jgi:hypothetical protein